MRFLIDNALSPVLVDRQRGAMLCMFATTVCKPPTTLRFSIARERKIVFLFRRIPILQQFSPTDPNGFLL